MHTKFQSEDVKERDHLGDGMGWEDSNKADLKKYDVRAWTGFRSLKMGPNGPLLRKQ
jgi:hypothetical protein